MHFLPIALPLTFRRLSSGDSDVIHIRYSLMRRNFHLREADFSGTMATRFRSDEARESVDLDDLYRWLQG